jgi:hypothetical protein
MTPNLRINFSGRISVLRKFIGCDDKCHIRIGSGQTIQQECTTTCSSKVVCENNESSLSRDCPVSCIDNHAKAPAKSCRVQCSGISLIPPQSVREESVLIENIPQPQSVLLSRFAEHPAWAVGSVSNLKASICRSCFGHDGFEILV